jgi:nucleoside-diphosphate-sugar epimerase
MRVLLTGGLGFIGRAFAKRLLDDGHVVTIVDNMYSGVELADWMFKPNAYDPKTRSVPNLQLMIGDCRSFFASSGNIWSANRFDLIIHCAAIVGGRIKIEDDPLEVAIDLAIDAEFFRWVTDKKPYPKVVYLSSSAVYPLELQTREKHVALAEAYVNMQSTRWSKPDQSYGFVKLAGEFLAKIAHEKYGLDVAIYRPFGGYGEDQDVKTYPFPAIIKRVVDGENPVMVWGSGDQERDFIHVDDIVEAVLQTYDKLGGKVLNLGTGIPTSFFQLAENISYLAAVGDVYPSVRNDPLKPEGVFSRVADTHEMSKLYTPKITLTEGIKRVLDRAKVKV